MAVAFACGLRNLHSGKATPATTSILRVALAGHVLQPSIPGRRIPFGRRLAQVRRVNFIFNKG